MACRCGGNRFVAHQVCRHDVVVDSDNQFVETCGTADSSIYDAETPYGPFTCLHCKEVWDTIPTYNVKRMKQVEMLLVRNDNTWDLLTMLVPEEEFTKIEVESEGDSYWYAGKMRERFTELAIKLLKPGTDIAMFDIYHIDDEWQDSVIGGESCLV